MCTHYFHQLNNENSLNRLLPLITGQGFYSLRINCKSKQTVLYSLLDF